MAHKTPLNDLRCPCSAVKTTMLLLLREIPIENTTHMTLTIHKTIFYNHYRVNTTPKR